MSDPAPAGFAILGAGLFPAIAYIPAIGKIGPTPPLKAIYSRSEKSAQQLVTAAGNALNVSPDVYFDQPQSAGKDLDALLARPDISAVIIALPINVQGGVIIRALKAGKHVLSEKPVAPSVSMGLKLIQEAQQYVEKGLIWRVAENFEVEPVYVKIGQLIKDGQIGDVKGFKASVKVYIDENSDWYKTEWRKTPEYQGGFLLDGGVHTSAALRTMLPGFMASQLVSFASLNKEILAPKDTIHAIVRTESYNGTLDFTWAWPTPSYPISDETIIMGSRGYIGISRRKQEEGGGWKVSLVQSGATKTEEVAFPSSGVLEEFKAFFNVSFGGQKEDGVIGNPLNTLFDVALIQATLDSNGALVNLGELWTKG